MSESVTRDGNHIWVCPNDRHLALRAKLQTGWSVKTRFFESRWGGYSNSYTSGSNRCGQSFLLTEDERQTIIQVIQRAEALDLSEQERVGRLVERLENMKRNVCVVTSTRSNERRGCGSRCSGGARCVCSCALCGERFGAVLGASANLCKDCRKYICQKCGIDATKINPSRIGGGGDGSIDAATSSPRGPSLRVVRLAQERTGVQRIVQRSRGNAQRQFLCRICAETREMWKKSGAWFFKSMPKYILPEKKEHGWSRPGHRMSTWTIGGSTCKSSVQESADPQDSSSDDDATRRLAVVRVHSVSSTNLPSNRDGTPTKSTLSSPVPSGAPSPRTPRGRPNGGLSPSGHRTDGADGSDKLDKSCLSIASQCSRLSPTCSIGTTRSKASGRSANGLQQVEQRVSFEESVEDAKPVEAYGDVLLNDTLEMDKNVIQDRSKCSQVQCLRLKTPTVVTSSPLATTPTTPSERFQTIANRTLERSAEREASKSSSHSDQDSSTSGTCSNSQVGTPRTQTPEYSQRTEQKYGTLEVSLRYDPADQCLQCKVERARHLMPMDIQGLADPFCKLNLLPVGKAATSRRLRTKTVHKTRDPEFNETVNFYGTTETDISTGKALHILIIQDDPSGQDFLGEARFPLQELQPYQTKHYKVSLQSHYQVDNEEETWGMCSSGRGQIQISLSYCTRRRALLVTVHRATNLLPMDSNGFSDPFVKLVLVENATDNHRQQRFLDNSATRATAKRLTGKKTAGRSSHSTSIKRKTLNPEWNEEFAFATRLTDMMKLTLCLSVWDKDFGKSNDYLGGLMLGCGSKGARLRHWIDAMKFADHRHLAWHNLAEMAVPME